VAVGCTTDPCANVSGTCISLDVQRSTAVTRLDGLAFAITSGGTTVARQSTIGKPFNLPAAVAVQFDSFPASAAVSITLDGTLGAASFGAPPMVFGLVRNQHVHRSVALGPIAPVADMSSGTSDAAPFDAAMDLAPPPCDALCPASECINGTCVKRVFVSSVVHSANFGGLAGADMFCQQLADAAQLGGSFKAWLSDDTGSPSTRFAQSAGPYVLVDGTPLADNWTALTTARLKSTISLTEKGGVPPTATTKVICCPSGQFVWSNTTVQGGLYSAAASCSRWSDATVLTGSMFGATGDSTSWSFLCSGDGCSALAPVFCVEQ
jgi:hypothetical protein